MFGKRRVLYRAWDCEDDLPHMMGQYRPRSQAGKTCPQFSQRRSIAMTVQDLTVEARVLLPSGHDIDQDLHMRALDGLPMEMFSDSDLQDLIRHLREDKRSAEIALERAESERLRRGMPRVSGTPFRGRPEDFFPEGFFEGDSGDSDEVVPK